MRYRNYYWPGGYGYRRYYPDYWDMHRRRWYPYYYDNGLNFIEQQILNTGTMADVNQIAIQSDIIDPSLMAPAVPVPTEQERIIPPVVPPIKPV